MIQCRWDSNCSKVHVCMSFCLCRSIPMDDIRTTTPSAWKFQARLARRRTRQSTTHVCGKKCRIQCSLEWALPQRHADKTDLAIHIYIFWLWSPNARQLLTPDFNTTLHGPPRPNASNETTRGAVACVLKIWRVLILLLWRGPSRTSRIDFARPNFFFCFFKKKLFYLQIINAAPRYLYTKWIWLLSFLEKLVNQRSIMPFVQNIDMREYFGWDDLLDASFRDDAMIWTSFNLDNWRHQRFLLLEA